ncbi:MAG: ABC transporter permease [Prevotella sp.]|nr:ABC transporter permease [Prevotella sp.]
MNLVWKLLRHHISIPQLLGFFFANLVGMLIVLLGYQFYRDVLPVFTADDSFMKSDFMIVSKRISASTTFSGRDNGFTNADIDELSHQPFVKKLGTFTRAEYRLDAQLGVGGKSLVSTELFLESVPDGFIDVPLTDWDYQPGSREVPVILPRSYVNMYNFGFAQTRSLPKISEGVMGMIDLRIHVRGNGHEDDYKGRVIGFSSRLNSILVPQAFMQWSNETYAPDEHSAPTRLLMEVVNPADENIGKFLERKGYDMEDDRLNAEKTTRFLRLLVTIVMIIGLVIAVLSFYILMLSIYLLVQKNASKLESLMLLGYTPGRVARPYQLLTAGLNAAVLILALAGVWLLRARYMRLITAFYPQLPDGKIWPAFVLGLLLFALVTLLNVLIIRRKMLRIWHRKE